MFEQTVAADEVVIEQGADGDFFYVVDNGVYHALIKTNEGEPLLKVFNRDSLLLSLEILFFNLVLEHYC